MAELHEPLTPNPEPRLELVDLITDDRDYISAGKFAALLLNLTLIPLLVFVVISTVWFAKILPEGLTAFVGLIAAIINGAHKAGEAWQRHLSDQTPPAESTEVKP